MKKFYSVLIATVLLLTSFISRAQVTYTSILTNPSHWTLDDPRFWGGAPNDLAAVPTNPCHNCIIKINSDVVVVPYQGNLGPNGGIGTTSSLGDFMSLDHLTLDQGTTLNVYGSTTLTINTWVTLDHATITIGNNPTSPESIILNDQIDMDASSSIRLANDQTLINVRNPTAKTNFAGQYTEILNGTFKAAGIYGIITTPFNNTTGSYSYSQILEGNFMGTENATYASVPDGEPFYTWNCAPNDPASLNTCGAGIVFGPVATAPDPDFGVVFVGSTVLPVTLVQFLAVKADDGSVQLKWVTSQEQNASNYEIERSGDQTGWTKIGTTKAKGFSSTPTNYTFSDRLPLAGTSYYRLKMNDVDGKFTYSKTVVVSSDKLNQPLVVYNNPFTDQIRLKVNVSKAQNLVLTVSDLQGKNVLTQSYNAQAGDNLINLQPNAGSGAMYILKINGNTYTQTVKLQKQ